MKVSCVFIKSFFINTNLFTFSTPSVCFQLGYSNILLPNRGIGVSNLAGASRKWLKKATRGAHLAGGDQQ